MSDASTAALRERFVLDLLAAKATTTQILYGLDAWRAKHVAAGGRADLDLQAIALGLIDLQAKLLELNINAVDFVGAGHVEEQRRPDTTNLH